jgi:hypothetical protein
MVPPPVLVLTDPQRGQGLAGHGLVSSFFLSLRVFHLYHCPLCPVQSDREKSEGLPVAPFMDRDKVTKATAQIGFIKFVLIPMFEMVTKVSA